MIIFVGIGDAESERDLINETRLWQIYPSGEIVACLEYQCVLAGLQSIALQQRCIAAPIGIGDALREQSALGGIDAKQRHHDTCSWLAGRNIEDVGTEFSHQNFPMTCKHYGGIWT